MERESCCDPQVRVVVKDRTHGLEFFRMLMCLNPNTVEIAVTQWAASC